MSIRNPPILLSDVCPLWFFHVASGSGCMIIHTYLWLPKPTNNSEACSQEYKWKTTGDFVAEFPWTFVNSAISVKLDNSIRFPSLQKTVGPDYESLVWLYTFAIDFMPVLLHVQTKPRLVCLTRRFTPIIHGAVPTICLREQESC